MILSVCAFMLQFVVKLHANIVFFKILQKCNYINYFYVNISIIYINEIP